MKNSADFFIEIDHTSMNKTGQIVCGDVFLSRKVKKEGRMAAVLSDGLGSGIKANVMATMTASMAMNFILADQPIERSARAIQNTLPQDETRKISFASFTIIDTGYDGDTRIIEYGNPQSLVFRNTTRIPLEQSIDNNPDTLATNRMKMQNGDRIVLFSDGVSQSGMGRDDMPFGWDIDALSDYISWTIGSELNISAHDLCRKIVSRANHNDHYLPKDDVTCAVLYYRDPRSLIVCSGPPYSMEKDSWVADYLNDFGGEKVICGGTTAQIISRELNLDLEIDLFSGFEGIPPISNMEGVDLITEGILTLGKVSETLDDGSYLALSDKNPAGMLVDKLLSNDKITFLVGTKINEAHQDPNLPSELDIRRNVIKRIAKILENEFFKTIEIIYV